MTAILMKKNTHCLVEDISRAISEITRLYLSDINNSSN